MRRKKAANSNIEQFKTANERYSRFVRSKGFVQKEGTAIAKQGKELVAL